jgi:translation initiation factor 2B subunit (eIF-2B alpha/beta/delta family)
MDTFLREINKIRQNREDGSLQILENSIELIMSYLDSKTFFDNVLKYQLNLLLKTFPDFAVLHHFISGINQQGNAKREISAFVSGYKRKWHDVERNISNHFLNNITVKGSTILLHSNSRTIHVLFEEIARRNLSINVLQTESQPGGEGILQAEYLRKPGFKVILIKEDDIVNHLNNIDMFLIGSDRIEPENIINKVGSETIAKLFINVGKPVYVLADSRKIIREIWPVKSVLFEKVTRKLITGVITEKGLIL